MVHWDALRWVELQLRIERLKDKDSYVRESVACALGAIGDARAVECID
jgi:HEAT repeat protein